MISIKNFCGLLLAAILMVACSDEDVVQESTVGTDDVPVTLTFSSVGNNRVSMTTRATLGEVPESRVQNFYLFFFANGARIYSHYFDSENLLDSESEVINSTYNRWWRQYNTNATNSSDITKGTVRAHVPSVNGATMYMVANIDADMVNISPEKLNLISSEEELAQLTASLNQEITSRNGYFPMVAKVEGVDISPNSGSGILKDGKTVEAVLRRLDAKVQVYVRVAKENVTSTTLNGVTTKQVLKEFVPESWRVVNLPKSSFVLENDEDCEKEFFNSEEVSFETEEDVEFTYKNASGANATAESKQYGFSFYMLENRPQPSASVGGDYHLRAMRQKDPATGKFTTDATDKWVYAPETATYLEIKGDVNMEVDVSSEAEDQVLTAGVTYYIHLGDIVKSMDDYNVERNTSYTYTITIKGVDKIAMEVETSGSGDPSKVVEDNAGAEGHVYVAKESVYTFDAHYGQRVFCFDAEHLQTDAMTWYVKTPFGKEGQPPTLNGVDIPAGFDYKWVQFMLNDLETSTSGNNAGNEIYSHKNKPYPGYKGNPYNKDAEGLMDVIAFTNYMKNEKKKLEEYLQDPENRRNTSAFRKEYDADYHALYPNDPDKYYRWRIYVTVYIDEFYYEAHPITGETSPDLWKQFVNKPNRIMHILCDSQTSLDGASSATGSVITLRQRSIQTPYNMNNEELETAWGCEIVDETAESQFFFFPSENALGSVGSTTLTNYTSNVRDNGLYNTVGLWGLNNGSNSFVNNVRWDKYKDYNRVNDYISDKYNIIWMKEDYACMQYATMMRNRDNNGNGFIDPEEIRWYVASLEQLYALYIGDQGLTANAQLYPAERSVAEGNYGANENFAGAHKWRLHIVSSTKNSDNKLLKLWSEEGISTGTYATQSSKPAPFSIRCIRNLGLSNPTLDNICNAKANIPSPIITFKKEGSGSSAVYYFDLRNVNEKSLRYYTSKELEPGSERAETARPYKGFMTGALGSTEYMNTTGYPTIYNALLAGNSLCSNSNYRMPNVREGAIMAMYCEDTGWWNGKYIISMSYYSHGNYGDQKDGTTPHTWRFYVDSHASVNQRGCYIREVRDWNPQ